MPELKLYTVSDLRNWLMHNNAKEGLSERIIAPTRAWAIIHNPYVSDDDPVVAAIFISHQEVAYTAAFPEIIIGKRIWWFSTLWCNPNYQGCGYGLAVIGSLAEIYGENCAWDRSGSPETVEIFSLLGNQRIYTPRYVLGDREININTIKGRIAFVRQNMLKYIHKKRYRFSNNEYELKYVTYIDNATYNFIKDHRGADLFMHTQDMLNWELQYPFMTSAPLLQRTAIGMDFHSYRDKYRYYAVQVWQYGSLIGFYILRLLNDKLSVVYFYTDNERTDIVYSSIVEHIHCMNVNSAETDNEHLAEYIKHHYYFPKAFKRMVSFSPAVNMELPNEIQMQLGDGDCFA